MVQPFDGGKYDKRFDDTFAPAVRKAGLEPYRVDRDPGASIPIDEVEKGIKEAAAVFVDITADNPNVWFELGFAIAAGKDLCLVCEKERVKYPFDIQHRSIIKYASEAARDFTELGTAITKRIEAILQQQQGRASIQAVTVDTPTAGLTEFELATLACAAGEASGIGDIVTFWSIEQAMDKAGFNKIACNVGLRGLLNKRMIGNDSYENLDGHTIEGYLISAIGWDWLTANADKLNMKKSRGGFNRKLDDEIPF